MVRKSLKLTEAEWKRLDELAAELHSIAKAGTTFGKPSWRALVKAIANNELELTPKENLS